MKKLLVTAGLLLAGTASCPFLAFAADDSTSGIVRLNARVEYLRSKRVDVMKQLVRLRLCDGKTDEARKLLTSDVARIRKDVRKGDLSRDDAQLLYLAGIVEEAAGNTGERDRLFALARQLAPADSRYHLWLAHVFDKLHREDIMEYELKQAIETKPGNREIELKAVERLAHSAFVNRQFARAADLFEKAHSLTERERKTVTNYSYYQHVCRGFALLGEGKPDSWKKALAECDKAWQTDVDGLETPVLGERIAAACPDEKQAEELRSKWRRRSDELAKAYRLAIAGEPHQPNYYNRLAWFLAEIDRDHDEGIRAVKRALELQPYESAYIDTLAELQFKKGDVAAAVKTIRRVVALFPFANDYYRHQLDRFEVALKKPKTEPAGAP